MPSNHLILCCPLFLLPSIFPSIRIFSNASVLCIRWPKHWSFSFISPSNEHLRLISFRMDWLDLLAVQEESSPTPKFKSINSFALISSSQNEAFYTGTLGTRWSSMNVGCGEQCLLFVVVHGLLTSVAFFVALHRPRCMGFSSCSPQSQSLWDAGFSWSMACGIFLD